MVYTLLFFLQNAVCFIILTYLVPVLFTFCIQCVLKFKKNNSVAKSLRILETKRGSTRSHSVQNSLWKRLWTCRKADCGVNEWRMTGYWVCRAPGGKRAVAVGMWTGGDCKRPHCLGVYPDRGVGFELARATVSLRRTVVTGYRLLWNNVDSTHFYSMTDNSLRRREC